MADVLYYAALDKYLYADTQLAAAQDQKTRADTRLYQLSDVFNQRNRR